ncbi:hypothetical protein N7448_006105 [Penicillium atrosanguineum]|uniref:Uncharacterized protein n=1 Tax=Penicillium atrosanguineum TaxID=1132637 RepID=A0A9W9U1B4_9EURO|nr:uncharacterized protein N7443_009866 [Penicillium atrosanguineum]KAJ5131947.1 hypothetical protein N7448_006105 [Penicillium atrosanguineum]KAJ5137843.1 hypothetical protein N7526_004076 [Penicillium atrosanguineum]KAJ5289613.1 hypothetical protein N7443_009866 [Penicillium atrosanguineum]KAJ5307432.1 hypothetical protein N7476_008088 [Penicillium atrosanguineum]
MRTSGFLAAALATLGAHADDVSSMVIGYFSPSWDQGLLQYGGWTSTAASLVAINTDAATYHVGCIKGAPKTDCNYPHSWTIVQGPETVSFSGVYIASTSDKSSSYEITVTESYECSLQSSTMSARCTMSVGETGSNDGGKTAYSSTTSATYSTAPMAESYYQLTVTAGLKSITEFEATHTSAATTTASAATQTGAAAAGPVGALITAAPMVAAAVVALL